MTDRTDSTATAKDLHFAANYARRANDPFLADRVEASARLWPATTALIEAARKCAEAWLASEGEPADEDADLVDAWVVYRAALAQGETP